MNTNKVTNGSFQKRNYKPFIIIISVILIGAIGVLSGMPGYEDFDAFDITILPLMNAIFNSFTFVFLVCALIAILKKKYNGASPFYLRSNGYDDFIFIFLCCIPFLISFNSIWRRRVYCDVLLFHFNHTYCTCGSHCATRINEYCTRMEYGK